MRYIYFYLTIINLVTLALFGADKIRAKRREWRIPEKLLIFFGVAGGALGGNLGMLLFRHKTQKPKFAVLFPLLLLAQAAIVALIYTGIITF